MYKVKKETASMITNKGVRLDADIYRPESNEQFPVLLMRQPYGRAIASTVVYAHPRWYAAQGYIVVIQDVRGRGTSGGEFELFANEIEDGFDTVNWASQLPGSSQEVGMYGFSYQGMTQLYAASKKPTALKTICPAMVAYDLYSDWAYENGAFCLQANLGWAVQLAAETARLKQDSIAYQILYSASRNLPYENPSSSFIECLSKFAPSNFYYQWLNHSHRDEYWQNLSCKKLIEDIDLPMLHIGGWFDPYLRGTLNLYQEMRQRSNFPQHLIVGPWAHLPWGRKLGAIDYGKEANSSIDEIQIEWFNYFLKAIDSPRLKELRVCLFEMGTNQWKYLSNWPQNSQQFSYYLTSNGLASIREDAGKLATEKENVYSEDIIVHDPWRPVPSLGGHASLPAGSFERSNIDVRSDVLTYTSEPLKDNLHIVGTVTVKIYCSTDSQSFDLCAILSELYPNGNVYNFTQGYMRVYTKEIINLSLQPTCIKIVRGNCLRLSLSAACFPAYPINTGKLIYGKTNFMDAETITLTINCGKDYPSQINF